MKIEKSSLLSALPSLSFLALLVIGIFPQSAAEPLMMLPFAALAVYLAAGNTLPRLHAEQGVLLGLLSLSLVWVISGLTSGVPFPSKVTWIILGTLPLSYLAARTLSCSPLSWLGIVALPFATYTLWEGVNGVNRPQLPFEDSNLLGLFFALSILALLPSLKGQDGKTQKYIAFVTALLLTAALIITQSRSALLCLAAGLSAFFFLLPDSLPSLRLPRSRTTWIASGLTLITILSATLLSGVILRFDFFENGILDPSITGRLAIWKASATMAFQHPLTGYGLGTFHLYYPQFRMAGDNSQGWMAHLDPLQSAIESGWLAPLFLYLVFATTAHLILKNRKTLTSRQAGAAAILTAFFLAMHINYPLHSVPFLMIAGAALATISFKDTAKQIPSLLSWGMLITLISSLWILLQATMTLMLLSESKLAANLHDQPRLDKAMTACLADGDPDFPDCRIMAAKFLIMAHATDHQRILTLLDEAEQGNPVSPEIPYQRALLESQKESPAPEQILAYLQLSLKRNPAYWPARRMAIGIYVTRKEEDKARILLQDGMIYRYAPPTRNDIRRVSKELGIELK